LPVNRSVRVELETALSAVWREDRWLWVAVACYASAVWLVLRWFGFPPFSLVPPLPIALVGLMLLAGVVRGLWLFANARPIIASLKDTFPGALSVALLLPWALIPFSAWKEAIVRLFPFTWDPALYRVSLLISGRPEWEWFGWVYRHSWSIHAVDGIYSGGWAVATVVTVLAMAWSPRRDLRRQYFWAMFITWVSLGSVGAALFGSGGPIFYRMFVPGPDPFAGLHAALEAHPTLLANQVASTLERIYRQQQWQVFGGISAMPSLHLGQATLSALTWQRAHPGALAIAGWLYVLAILTGSVILGWHYACDGYVSIVVAAGIWWAAGRFGRR
jgi:hypothetical protein